MLRTNKSLIAGILGTVILLFSSSLFSFDIVHHPNDSKTIDAKWNWAVNRGRLLKSQQGFWVGYSIVKKMERNAFYFSHGKCFFGPSSSPISSYKGRSLGEQIYGKTYSPSYPVETTVKEMARQVLNFRKMKGLPFSREMVDKDLAILFLLEPNNLKFPKTIRFCNLSVSFTSDEQPLIWLGKIPDINSFSFLKRYFKGINDSNLKKRMISAIGIHPGSNYVIPFLTKLVKSNEDEEIRGKAAAYLGDHDTKQSLQFLIETANNDSSLYVRKKAVYAMEDLKQAAAVDALITLAKTAGHLKIRKCAINTLGDIASRKASEALTQMVYQENDTEIQKQAVHAIEDFPNGEGIPLLIKIAKTHPKLSVKKRAINCLGDSGDQRALKALIEIIKK